MLENINIENILFIDIETVPMCAEYSQLKENFKKLWDKKAENLITNEGETPESIFEKAGIYAEFGKIICISAGFFKGPEFRIRSFYGHDEKELLKEFIKLCNSYYDEDYQLLCGHNAKEFDYPYIARRILINGLKIPSILDITGKKPWEVNHLDTMQLWKFGDYKSYTSLELLATVFNIPTPKDDITGSDVARVYWKENDMERIKNYCQKDVLTVVQLFLKYQGKPMIEARNVVIC